MSSLMNIVLRDLTTREMPPRDPSRSLRVASNDTDAAAAAPADALCTATLVVPARVLTRQLKTLHQRTQRV
eukprot:6209676-Pleurochrysis_carterae.AAC.3